MRAADVPCVILAGGLATRMQPLTERIPKILLPVAGEPFVDHQLRWLQSEGVRDVILAVGHLAEMLEDHVGDGGQSGVHVSYSRDGHRPLGTGGALRKAIADHAVAGPVLVLYGDSYLTVGIDAVLAAFAHSGLPALMTVYENRGEGDASNAAFTGGLVRYEKCHPDPAAAGLTMIDYGLSAFDSALVLERIPPKHSVDLAVVQTELSRERLLGGFVARHRFFEIGSTSGLADLEAHLLRARRSGVTTRQVTARTPRRARHA